MTSRTPTTAAPATAEQEKDPYLIGRFRFNPKWVQKPWSDSYFRWLVVISFAVWYNLILIIPRVVFHELQEPGPQVIVFVVLDYFCDILFLVDMVLKMLTGYLENGILTREPRKLMRKYFKSSTFVVDVISIFPTDLIFIQTGWAAPFPILRINRLLRTSRVSEFYYRAQTRLDSPNTFRLIYLILTMIVVVHLNACVYFFISSMVGIGTDRWAYPGRAGWRFLVPVHGASAGHGGGEHGAAAEHAVGSSHGTADAHNLSHTVNEHGDAFQSHGHGHEANSALFDNLTLDSNDTETAHAQDLPEGAAHSDTGAHANEDSHNTHDPPPTAVELHGESADSLRSVNIDGGLQNHSVSGGFNGHREHQLEDAAPAAIDSNSSARDHGSMDSHSNTNAPTVVDQSPSSAQLTDNHDIHAQVDAPNVHGTGGSHGLTIDTHETNAQHGDASGTTDAHGATGNADHGTPGIADAHEATSAQDGAEHGAPSAHGTADVHGASGDTSETSGVYSAHAAGDAHAAAGKVDAHGAALSGGTGGHAGTNADGETGGHGESARPGCPVQGEGEGDTAAEGEGHEEGGHEKPMNFSTAFVNDTLFKKYSYCMYWSVKMMTSKPYELHNPTTTFEFVFHIIDAFLGIFMFASIVGEVDGIIESINKASDDFKSKLDSVKQYISMRKVGKEMESRVVKWFDYIWANSGSLDEESVLTVLPENLRMEIARHVHLDVLKKVPIFQGIDEQFLLELAEKLKFEAFCPGDYVCRKGDIGREIYVVRRGLLNVIAADGVKVIVTLKSGVVFGELSLLNVPGSVNGNRRTVTVRSVGYADLFSLSKEDFWTSLEEYPEVREQLMAKAKTILQKDNLVNEEAAREAARRGRNFQLVAERLEENLDIINARMTRFWQEQSDVTQNLLIKLERLEKLKEQHEARSRLVEEKSADLEPSL